MALADSGSVLTDQNGNAIPLASQQAADIWQAGDPYIIRGGTTYHFSTIQAAINFSMPGKLFTWSPVPILSNCNPKAILFKEQLPA